MEEATRQTTKPIKNESKTYERQQPLSISQRHKDKHETQDKTKKPNETQDETKKTQ